MDPISVVGLLSGITTLNKLLDDGLLGLVDFINHSRRVDQTVQGFHDDIEALSVTIASIAARFKGNGGSEFALESQASREAAHSLSISVGACKRLVQGLKNCIPQSRSSVRSDHFLWRLWLQGRLNYHKDTIRGVQSQIQIHTSIINTAFNLLIFDCVIQSNQNQQVAQPYNNLIGSLEILQKGRARLSRNHDAESALALQNARTLSTSAENSISDSVSIVGNNSTRATSAPASATSASGPGEATAGLESISEQPGLAKRSSTRKSVHFISASQSTPSDIPNERQTQEDKGNELPEEFEGEDSGYASLPQEQGFNYSNSVLPPSTKQLRLEARRLLQSHGYPTTRVRRLALGKSHKRALKWAATEGHVEAVKYLIDQGTLFDIHSEIGASALIAAIDSGHAEVVKFLLSLVSPDELKRSSQAQNASFAAARRGDYAVLGILLHKGADPNSKNGNQSTPLHVAAQHSYLNVVKQLLLNDADVFAKDEAKRTPLHVAVTVGSVAVTRTLLEHRSEANAKDLNGDSPFHIAFRSENLDLFKCLVEFSVRLQLNNDGFVRSAVLDQLLNGEHQRGFCAFVECLHAQNLLIYTRIEEIVHYIAYGNHREALKFLCDNEVLTGPHSLNATAEEEPPVPEEKPIMPEKRSTRAFSNSRRHQSVDTLDTLPVDERYYRYQGVNFLYENGDTLQDQQGRNEQVLKRSVDAKDGRTFRETLDQMNPTPGHPDWPISVNTLCYIVRRGDIGMLQALFWIKVDINGTDADGWAAVHYAAYERNMYDKLLMLHSAGADLNVKTTAFRDKHEAGETALSLALKRCAEFSDRTRSSHKYWAKVAQALRSRGARVPPAMEFWLEDGGLLRIPVSRRVPTRRPSRVI